MKGWTWVDWGILILMTLALLCLTSLPESLWKLIKAALELGVRR